MPAYQKTAQYIYIGCAFTDQVLPVKVVDRHAFVEEHNPAFAILAEVKKIAGVVEALQKRGVMHAVDFIFLDEIHGCIEVEEPDSAVRVFFDPDDFVTAQSVFFPEVGEG